LLKFLLRRVANSLVLVVLATSLAYLLAGATLNPRARFEGRNPPPPPEVVDRQLDQLNLNDKTPLLKRYWHWAKGVVHLDFGKTVQGDNVNDELGRRMGVSLRLLLIATILGGFLGVAVGAWGAIRQYKFSDQAMSLASFAILSTPVIVLGIVFQVIAVKINDAAGHKIFEYSGEYTPGLGGSGYFAHFGDRLQHLVLPSLVLVLGEAAILSRYQRSAMLDVLSADYVRTAQAKGLRRRTALVKHALRTALIPSATYFAYSFGTVLVGATLTEKIFGWHGMGEYAVDSITSADTNAVAAVAAITAIFILVAGLLSDVAYALLDPRVRVD
jgi:peptide/nickel transport system permease protein